MRVEQLWRYPVKSVGGERVEHVTVTQFGFDGDRRWGILDRETGLFLTARREPRLLLTTATLTEQGFPQLLLPDGSLAPRTRTPGGPGRVQGWRYTMNPTLEYPYFLSSL